MIVAIPKFHETIAPRFKVAKYFIISVVTGGRVVSSKIEDCTGCEGFGRIRLLRDKKVNILICNGIKSFYRDLLGASGLTVIPNIALPAGDALAQFLAGELKPEVYGASFTSFSCQIPREDLVCWAKELFESHGYDVTAGPDKAAFPIDLVAEMRCPVCRKPVRVAICCGAHTYRTDQEIKEFHRAAASDYHARVYVHPGTPSIHQCCKEYGIELIDPDSELTIADRPGSHRIPILQEPLYGHEKASATKET